MPAFDRDRAALILIDALLMGARKAAEKWEITERTVENYRERLRSDPAFSVFFSRVQAKHAGDWKVVRLKFLRAGIAKLQELVAMADSPKHIAAVSEAVKTVGELQIVSDALHVSDSDPLEGEELAEEPTGGAPGSPASPAPTLQ